QASQRQARQEQGTRKARLQTRPGGGTRERDRATSSSKLDVRHELTDCSACEHECSLASSFLISLHFSSTAPFYLRCLVTSKHQKQQQHNSNRVGLCSLCSLCVDYYG